MNVIEYEGSLYPEFQSKGNASQFAIPFAKHVCQGFGYDVGCKDLEWAYPSAVPIDLSFDDDWDADNLPLEDPDYSQKYWRPWNNRQHNHVFTPEIIRDYMNNRRYKNVFVSGVDLNNAFMAIGEK